jgi:CBS domain containing-hemolysin-like protein
MLGDFRFEVLEQSDRRIELVRVARVLSEPAQE